MNLDCRDCGDEWCPKHVPVTRELFCSAGHKLKFLSEGHAWCHGEGKARFPIPGEMPRWHWWLWDILRDEIDDEGSVEVEDKAGNTYGATELGMFNSYEELNDWFIANIVALVVTP